MRTTIHLHKGSLFTIEQAYMLFNEIDPIGNNPGTDDGGHVRVPPKVPQLEEVTPDQYYPENTEGPDPTEEEQRDQEDLENTDSEEERHPEKPDHEDDDIYNPDDDQAEDVEEKGI
ncbi:hypothetical protein HX021_03145 [Sphingobacterium sp. N143]|uniref:hypothetical protein n=1 Tax=Sphingobacterium sp. N143 TaxID=2746727 RepID=UPI0025779003|nr:hypothetical protein [Sphingobacterium sp. N143]MDM1293287.1 hypothetical protein [Sphingobacterium sp. N143]